MSGAIIKKLANIFTNQQMILNKLAQVIPGSQSPVASQISNEPIQMPKSTVDTGKMVADFIKELSEKPEWKQATPEQKENWAADLSEAINALAGEAKLGE